MYTDIASPTAQPVDITSPTTQPTEFSDDNQKDKGKGKDNNKTRRKLYWLIPLVYCVAILLCLCLFLCKGKFIACFASKDDDDKEDSKNVAPEKKPMLEKTEQPESAVELQNEL